mmetsp:Transcript_13212/g.32249  ORF Transcript_13212/g.32249 Transcript_13212/m.32249 type:complete len:1053 (+) Transcript_13212:508-3666(+)
MNADDQPTARLGPSGLQPIRPGSGGGSNLPRISPPDTPPESAKSTARQAFEAGETPKKIKWVPHTHTNPMHARFCYMCLHGALEGKDELVATEVTIADDDLPSTVEMRNRGYLHVKEHARQLADFRRNNLPATWLRGVVKEVYAQNKNLLLELNTQIAREDPRSPVAGGGTWFLVYEDEEKRDWKVVERLFELLPDDLRHLDRMQRLLTRFCQSRPLFSYNPPPPKLEDWCKVTILEKEKKRLVYTPMADLTGLPIETQKMIDDLEERAVQAGSTEDLMPWPSTLRRLGDFKIIPRKYTNAEIPEYEPMEAPLPRRPDIPNIGDPFPKPNCYIHHFQEKGMPEFEVPLADPQQFPPRKIALEYMHPAHNYTMRHFPMQPFLDHPVWPPVEFVQEYDDPLPQGFDKQLKKTRKIKRKKLVTRGIWEPELVSMKGDVLPPYMERVRNEKHAGTEEDFDEMQVDDSLYVTMKGGTRLVQDMISIICVRSFARFAPSAVKLKFPDFLNNIATVDWTGENTMQIVKQRHEVLIREMEREEREFRESQQHEQQLQALDIDYDHANPPANADGAVLPIAGPAEEKHDDFKIIDDDNYHEEGLPPEKKVEPTSESTRQEIDEQQRDAERAGGSGSQGQQPLAAGAAGGSQASSQVKPPAVPESGTGPAQSSGSAAGGEEDELEASYHSGAGVQAPALPQSGLSKDQLVLQRHQKRLQAMIDKDKDEKRIEQILTKDKFLDVLASKLSEKMSISAALTQDPARGPGRVDSTREGWHPGMDYARPAGDLTAYRTPAGSHMTMMQQPPQPNFIDDDDMAKVEGNKLPRSLRGDDVAGPTPALAKSKIADANTYTEERARGDAYVRMLTKPDEEGAKKHAKPYNPIVMEPDDNLVLGEQFHLKQSKEDDVEEDFADLEDSNTMLFSFVRHNRYEALQSLLEQDAALINVLDDRRNSLLHIACQNNHRRIAKLLIRAGVDMDSQNSKGNTALHYCYAYNFMQLAGVLLAKGADDGLLNDLNLPPSKGIALPDPHTGLVKHEKQIEKAIRDGNPQLLDPAENLRPK